ncbi:MAG: aminoacetone oxidase family FAD-binding enzyme [Crocinitomicaceae bacterium]|nr:aminoacetone oxidase family FAD-binding enzyme [Crocinitomicaceae bacterium]
MSTYHLAVIGGGAAGFFAAINAAVLFPQKKIVILEKSGKVLSKVKISGGGRCNVTHACFDPKELVAYYPRGSRELIGPFNQFQPGDTIEWFARRGVELSTEDDGRVFPVSNCSQTIIDCFESEVRKLGIKVRLNAGVTFFENKGEKWEIMLASGEVILTDDLIIASGSSPQMWDIIKNTGHTIVDPVPSLFTFKIDDLRIRGLAGLSSPSAYVQMDDSPFVATGPLLITHWGLSGPGVLKLSAIAAVELAKKNYRFNIVVNWDHRFNLPGAINFLKERREQFSRKKVFVTCPFSFPVRLWQSLIREWIPEEKNWADLSNKNIEQIAESVCRCRFNVFGKSTFKEEFVTAGGVHLNEIDFKTMGSKRHPHLYFAGEVLNIDAVTGGFNFQAAWTTAWIAAKLEG